MKAIIDISDGDYMAIQSGGLYYIGHDQLDTIVTKAFQNATPYEERLKGEWKIRGMFYYCSNCGEDYEQSGNNFCGHCGADMRGEEE